MSKIFALLVTALIVVVIGSCYESKETEPDNNVSLDLPKDGYSFKLAQRREIKIPTSGKEVIFAIDDITGGQTNAILRSDQEIYLSKSIRSGQQIEFELDHEKYRLVCDQLINQLIGDDQGVFTLKKVKRDATVKLSEKEKIQALIQVVENSTITFIRNGTEHTAKEASEHLRMKLDQADGQITTLNSFIENIASKSSMTGKPYQAKTANGKVVAAEFWFNEQVKKLKLNTHTHN